MAAARGTGRRDAVIATRGVYKSSYDVTATCTSYDVVESAFSVSVQTYAVVEVYDMCDGRSFDTIDTKYDEVETSF